jgi:hypothetical protein
MKKRKMKKLQLNRETLSSLDLSRVEGALEAVDQPVAGGKALSIPRCTWVVSDCLYCTTPIDNCPDPSVT